MIFCCKARILQATSRTAASNAVAVFVVFVVAVVIVYFLLFLLERTATLSFEASERRTTGRSVE